jgi:cytochrome c biogenesis protein CcmG, thiol:disulfide interchange protein DsbE
MLHLNARWHRASAVALGLLLSLHLLSACGGATGASTGATQEKQTIALADLPAGLGRGYPVAQVDSQPTAGGLLTQGEPAPDFAMVLDDGRYLRLSELQGKPVVLNFWATWCGPCRLEMPELVKAAGADPNLVVLATDVQEARSPVEDFAAAFRMNLPIVLDKDGKVRNLYRVPGLPTTYFIDTTGRIASVVVGPLTPQVLADRLAEIQS